MYASREAKGTTGALKGGSSADGDGRPRARDMFDWKLQRRF